jgi:predicted ATPase/DNA-binding SARP family transcriptional activator
VTVEFRLLGDVDIRLDGRRIDVGHARQRCVLAALVIDVNRPVPAEHLIDRVWADRPPYRARNALSAYISRLRRLVGATDGVRIAREPGGYVVSTDPMCVDLHRFRHLAGLARAAEDPADAADLFDQALEIWMGEPFPALDAPWFRDLRTSLEAERLAVVLDRNDAALAVGRHAALVGELTTAVRAHPLDERLAGQLMLAQYRSGRQADALATYQRIRHRLRDELGSDPGPALQQAHQQVLTGEAAVPAHPVTGRARHRTTLPRRATSFVGRDREIGRAAEAISDGALVTLTGVGGVGKSRLALEVAARQEPLFPDGVWLCELAPLDDGAVVGHAVAAALGVHQQHGLTIEQSVIEYLCSRRLLLVLDNCEHVLDATAVLLDQVLRGCPKAAILATSREALGVEGEQILPVPPLSDEDAAALFAERARATRPDFRIAPDIDAVGEICRRLDGLPLAIELAAARMRAMSAWELADRLHSGRLVSRGTRGSPSRHQSLSAAIDWSYRLLSEAEKSLFGRLSVFAGGFDLGAAHAVCADPGTTEDDTLELLIGLVDKSMVTALSNTPRSRYRLLETLRVYGRDRLQEAGLENPIARRHATYFTDLAEQAARAMHGPHEGAWVQRVLPDYDNLRAAFERVAADRDSDLALRLIASLPELAYLRVGYESARWAERALEFASADHPLFVAAVGSVARGAWNRGDFLRARSVAGIAGGRAPGRGTGRIAYPGDVVADVALYEGDVDAALRYYDAEVLRARRDDDPIRLVWTLYYVSICHAVRRAPERGLAAAEESMRVAEATGNPTARSMARYALGLVVKKSHPDRALALFEDAAVLAASVRNFWWQGIALMEAAATRSVHGDAAAAAQAFVDVLDHWGRVGDWTQQWLNLRYVVRLLARLGADADAVALHHCLVAAGKPTPLDAARLARLAADLGPQRCAAASRAGAGLSGAEAVRVARAALLRSAT